MRSTSPVAIARRSAISAVVAATSTYSRSQLTGTFISAPSVNVAELLAREKRASQGRREPAYRVEIRGRPRTTSGDALQPPRSRNTFAGGALKLPRQAQVVLPEKTEGWKPVTQHRDALEAHAEREPCPLLRVEPDELEQVRVDHARAGDLDPPRVTADRAAGAAAEKARDVRLERGLREREVVRAEAHLALLAEEPAHHVEERPLQVGHRDPAVDRETLDLVEDRRVRRVGRVAPVDAAERDHVNRRRLLLHDPDL